MGDRTRGLFAKFSVHRVDGSDTPGGKHENCELYVLDATHDPHTTPALLAYADSCEADYPLLARDVRAMVARNVCPSCGAVPRCGSGLNGLPSCIA